MDQDGLVINSHEELEKNKFKILNSLVDKNVKEKMCYVFEILKNYNFEDYSIFFEDLTTEFEFVFFRKESKDSGNVIVNIRDEYSKFYIYGCKFFSSENKTETIKQFQDFFKKTITGMYKVKKTTNNNKLLSYEIEIDNIIKKINYGFSFFRLKKSNLMEVEFEGVNFLHEVIGSDLN